MTWRRVWRWGVVLPATLACFAGVIADVVTSTLFYWWLLVPAYVVMFIANWRDSGPWWNPPQPPEAAPLLVERVPSFNPFSALWGGVRWLLRLLGVFTVTFIYALLIEAAIAFLTWVKPYWQVYVPILVALAAITGLIWRAGAPRGRRRHPQDGGLAPPHDAPADG